MGLDWDIAGRLVEMGASWLVLTINDVGVHSTCLFMRFSFALF
jgi:hypothetical protein